MGNDADASVYIPGGVRFSGKTIVPFCTHEGSGLGHSEKDIAKLCPKATLLKGLAIHGSRVRDAQKDVMDWLKNGMIYKLLESTDICGSLARERKNDKTIRFRLYKIVTFGQR